MNQNKNPHSDFSENSIIWRYLTFPAFVAILEYKALFFTNLSNLLKDDPFEGALPKAEPANILDQIRILKTKLNEPEWVKETANKSLYKNRVHQTFIDTLVVNCWHLNESESDAMWKIYARTEHAGIAIKSSVRRLKTALKGSNAEIIKINYIDFDNFDVKTNQATVPGWVKSRFFSHECELRAYIYFHDAYEARMADAANAPRRAPVESRWVACSLESLIESIIISPLSPPWVFELLSKVIERYGLKTEIKPSRFKLAAPVPSS